MAGAPITAPASAQRHGRPADARAPLCTVATGSLIAAFLIAATARSISSDGSPSTASRSSARYDRYACNAPTRSPAAFSERTSAS